MSPSSHTIQEDTVSPDTYDSDESISSQSSSECLPDFEDSTSSGSFRFKEAAGNESAHDSSISIAQQSDRLGIGSKQQKDRLLKRFRLKQRLVWRPKMNLELPESYYVGSRGNLGVERQQTKENQSIESAGCAHGSLDGTLQTPCKAATESPPVCQYFESNNLLSDVTTAFEQLAQSDGIELDQFIKCSHAYIRVLEGMGASLKLAAVNDQRNLSVLIRCAEFQPKCIQLGKVLELEAQQGIHKPGGILQDKSAAMASLWLRRSIAFTTELLQRLLDCPEECCGSSMQAAYNECLKPYHGFLLQKVFAVAASRAPSRDGVLESLGHSIDGNTLPRELVVHQIQLFIKYSYTCTRKLEDLSRNLDLEDLRRV